jgi:hypothetical protein
MTISALSTPLSSTSQRASRMVTHTVFNSGATSSQIETLAVNYIRSVLTTNSYVLHSAFGPILPPLPPLPEPTPALVWDGLQSDLRNVTTATLLRPLTVPPRYRPHGGPKEWVTRMLFGGCSIDEPAQLQKDLGLDLGQHGANVCALRQTCHVGWRLLVRADLLKLYRLSATIPQHAELIRSVVHDHAILIGAVRARMLAEYLRRLASEPMGPRLDSDDPLWAKRSALYVDRLTKPAKKLDQLLRMAGGGSVDDTLAKAVTSGRLANDPRLLPLAERIYQQLGGVDLDIQAAATLVRAVRTAIAPLTAITPAMLHAEGLGRQSFAEAQLGLSASEAVTVLAINLVSLKGQVRKAMEAMDGGYLLPANPSVPAVPADGAARVCRTTTALKAISGCDRHVGNRSTDSDNKAGLKLLFRVERRLAEPVPPAGLQQLRLLMPELSR